MSNLSHLSYLGVFLAVFARQLCLPVPALLFLMTAGALAAQGKLHATLVLAAGVLGCLAGDLVWFRIGRRWGTQVMRGICSFSSDPVACSDRAHNVFGRWGLRTLVIAKFIPGLDGVTPPLAGAEGSPVLSFLFFDSIGALLWSGSYTVIGYIFTNELTRAIAWTERFGKIMGLALGSALLLFIVWRASMLLAAMRRLRMRRMGPALLFRTMESGDRLAIIDLLRFEDGNSDDEGIAGAVRIDPKLLRSSGKIRIPEDVKVVLYCSSRKGLTSARVAMTMRRRGISNVWLLEGGLAAWKAERLPTTRSLSTREDLLLRLNIELPNDSRSKS